MSLIVFNKIHFGIEYIQHTIYIYRLQRKDTAVKFTAIKNKCILSEFIHFFYLSSVNTNTLSSDCDLDRKGMALSQLRSHYAPSFRENDNFFAHDFGFGVYFG